MNHMLKRILGWVIFALIAVFIGFIVWLFFFREEPVDSNFNPTQRGESFFPVDLANGLDRQGQLDQGNRTEGRGTNFIPRLRQLSKVPVAGSVTFERQTGSTQTFISDDGVEEERDFTVTIFRYLERATGHLYETKETSLTQTRLSNTTIPKVYEAAFTNDGDYVLLRYLADDEETIETLSAAVVAKSTTSPETFQLVADGYALEGEFLPQNVISADLIDSGLAYNIQNIEGGSSIIISDLADEAKRIIYESPFTQWVVQRPNVSTVTLTPKADSRALGYLYFLNTSGGQMQKVLSDIPGLTTLTSPNTKWIIYSVSRENGLNTYALNTETDEEIRLGFDTLPADKCVFSKRNEDILYCGADDQPERVPYPETWYQGITSFNDNLWKVNLETEEYEPLLINQEEVAQSFDMIDLQVSEDDEFILFTNKKDLTLWSVDTTRQRGEQ